MENFCFTNFFEILTSQKKSPKEITWVVAKLEKTGKQEKNQKIFVVTLTEKFSMPDYTYK